MVTLKVAIYMNIVLDSFHPFDIPDHVTLTTFSVCYFS